MRAASRRRLLALLILLLGAGLGSLVLIWFEQHGERWLSHYLVGTGLQSPWVTGLVLGLPALPLAGFAFYLYRLARRAQRERRFPPEGVFLAAAARPIKGDAAIRNGRILQILALLLGLAVLALPVLLGLSLYRLGGD